MNKKTPLFGEVFLAAGRVRIRNSGIFGVLCSFNQRKLTEMRSNQYFWQGFKKSVPEIAFKSFR
jgi:hypothetical protein